MTNHKNLAGESGSFNPLALAIAAAAIFALGMGVATALAPTAAAPQISAITTEAAGEGSGYVPAQYVNQAKEVEPMEYYSTY